MLLNDIKTQNHLTNQQLAEILQCSASRVSKLLSCRAKIKVIEVVRLKDYLDVSPEDFDKIFLQFRDDYRNILGG